ncbi:MAG: hypothetical protein J7J44_07465 [Deltaproteobacteria bacterium]|nr:hypothetical protein [Deltaproteobacteria bacterium]
MKVVIAYISESSVWLRDSEGRFNHEILGIDEREWRENYKRKPAKVIQKLYEMGYKLEGGGCGAYIPPWAKSLEREQFNCLLVFVKS